MRRFLDIIGSALLITIAVFGIYLCVFVGFKLSAEKKPDTPSPTPIEELSLKGYWYFDDGGIEWFNIKDEEVESGIGFLEDNKLLITPAIVVCPIS